MTQYRKNLMVGVVVIGATGILGWMILKFGDRPAALFAPPQIPVVFITDRADGISEGAQVLFRGVSVGRVTKVARTTDNLQVRIDALVAKDPPLPGNVTGAIRTQGLVGSGASLALVTRDAVPAGALAANTVIPTKFVGLDILPPEFAELAKELRLAVARFNESGLQEHLDQAIVSIRATSDGARQAIEHIDAFVNDKTLKANLNESLDNIRTATATATRIGTNLEKFSNDLNGLTGEARATIVDARATVGQVRTSVSNTEKQVSDRLDQISKVLENINSITAKIDKGQGTAGLLINDTKLYESLVDSSRELKTTISDFNRLVEQWEQEGVYFNLSGKKK